MSLKNLEAVISYKDIKNIHKNFPPLKGGTKGGLQNFKKDKLKKYLKTI
ncbi:MAG: hypothetical protein LBD88_04740 [Candidatus Peribacteria bacterium]|jgi:hypothetical protein|nr:hypothetical protein [Candidatus Peribacteria bacterium]